MKCSNCGEENGEYISPKGFLRLNMNLNIPMCGKCQKIFWKWHLNTLWYQFEECNDIMDDVNQIAQWFENGIPHNNQIPPSTSFKKWIDSEENNMDETMSDDKIITYAGEYPTVKSFNESKVFVGANALHIKKGTKCDIIIEDGADVTIRTVSEIN